MIVSKCFYRIEYATLTTVVVVFSPLFLQYSIFIPVLLFPEFFLLVIALLSLFLKLNVNVRALSLCLLLYSYILFISFFRTFSENYVSLFLSFTTSGRLLFYFLLVILLSDVFKRDFGAKLIVFVAFFNAIYGLLQFYSFNVLGYTLPWYLPFLNVEHGAKLITDQDYIFQTFGFRFSGLFSEPAHFSQYVGFSFLVLLFYKSGRFFGARLKLIFSFVFSVALLLSASGTGFFVLMFLIGAYSFSYIASDFNFKKFFLGVVGFFLVVSLFVFVLLNNEFFAFGVGRITNLDDNSSFYVRLVRPLAVFIDLDFLQKIFGVGYGNFSTYLESVNLFNSYERYLGFAWTNSLGVFLVGSGLIGTLMVFLYYLVSYLETDEFGKLVVLFLSFHFLFSDLPHSIFFVCFMLFVTSSRNSFCQR